LYERPFFKQQEDNASELEARQLLNKDISPQ
jgi:hypothetical protein